MQLTLFSNRRYKVNRKETTKEKKGKNYICKKNYVKSLKFKKLQK